MISPSRARRSHRSGVLYLCVEEFDQRHAASRSVIFHLCEQACQCQAVAGEDRRSSASVILLGFILRIAALASRMISSVEAPGP